MPRNVTLDDRSPLIHYSGKWRASSKSVSNNDTMVTQYSDTTNHRSQAPGDTASVKFNGTAVYVYGAKRPNFGTYNISVDGSQEERHDAYAPAGQEGDGLFKQLLFARTGLDEDTLHEIVLTNSAREEEERQWFDIDYIVWTSSVNNDAVPRNFDDVQPSWDYKGVWKATTPGFNKNETGHATDSSGSYAEFTFRGEAVYIYGYIYTDHGLFNVSVDGQDNVMLNAYANYSNAETVLYYADSLGPGDHSVRLTNAEDKIFTVDYAQVLNAEPISSPSSQPAVNASSIVAGVVCGVVGLVLLLLVLWYIARRRRQKKQEVPQLIYPATELQEVPPPGYAPASAGPGWDGSLAAPVYQETSFVTPTSRKEYRGTLQPNENDEQTGLMAPTPETWSTSYEWDTVASNINEPLAHEGPARRTQTKS